MSDENINIVISDKVSPSIASKINRIAAEARIADSAIKNLKTQLASINVGALAQISSASLNAARLLNANAIAAQRLATEQQRTATAAQNLATAQARANAAQTQGQAAAQRLATEQARASAAAANAAAASDRAALAALRLQQAQDRVAQSSQRAGASIAGFARGAAAFVGVGLSAHTILESADAYTILQNKLQNVSDSEAQVTELTRELFNIANKTRTPVQETSQAFTRFDLALKNLGKSQKDSLRLTETVNKMLVMSGATTNEVGSSLLQLSQAFNKGKLDGDEFRSVMELMPSAADAIAKKLGVTRGELLKLAPEGKITAQIMVDAFNDAANSVDAKFGKSIPTLSQAMTVLRNNATETFGEINKQLGITNAISSVILFLAENMKILALVAAVAGAALLVAFGPVLLGALGAAGSALAAFTVALAANPIGLLIVGITAAIAALGLFGNKLTVTSDGLVTLKDVALAVFSYIKDAVNAASDFIKGVWNSAIDAVNSKTDGWGEQFRNVAGLILSIASNTANVTIGLFVGAYDTIRAVWSNFPEFMNYIFSSVVNSGASAVESLVNNWQSGLRLITKMGADIAPEFAGRLNSVLDQTAIKVPKIQVAESAKKAAGEVKAAMTNALGRNYVGEAGSAIMKRAREESAKRRASGEVDSSLRGTGVAPKVSSAGGSGKGGKGSTENRADALAKVNRELDNELSRMNLLKPEREAQAKFDQIEAQLLGKKIKLSQEEANAIKEKILAVQEATKVQSAMDSIYEQTIAPQKEYTANLAAADKLLKMGALSQQQYAGQVAKATEAYKQSIDPLYKYNKELDQQQKLLQMLPKEREIEQKIMQVVEDSLQSGNVSRKEEIALLKEKLVVIQQLNAVSQQEASLMDASVTKRQTFIDQLTAIKNLRANEKSGFTAGDQATAANSMLQGMGIDTSNFQSNLDSQLAMYSTYNDQVKAMYDQRLITEQEYASASMQIEMQRQNVHLNSASSFFGSLSALQKSENKKMAAVGKAAAIAQALITTYQSANSAYASMAAIPVVGPALGTAAAAMAIAAGLANVAQIRSQGTGFKEGGYTGSIGANEVAGVVHGREYVMDAAATSRIGVGNLQALQSGAAGVQRNGKQAGVANVGNAPAAAPTPVVNTSFNAVVVQSKEAALAGLRSAEGQAFIIETIEQNGGTIAKIVGVK